MVLCVGYSGVRRMDLEQINSILRDRFIAEEVSGKGAIAREPYS